MTALRQIVKRRSFGAMEEELLRDRIVCGITDGTVTVRRQLLQKKALRLSICIDTCRESEATAISSEIYGKDDIHAAGDLNPETTWETK